MMEKTVRFSYNSALVALNERGSWDDIEFQKLIPPLRGQLMKPDGLTGCRIARYAVKVDYFPEIISDIDLEAHVKQVFEQWAPENNFFPLRGEKPIKLSSPEKI